MAQSFKETLDFNVVFSLKKGKRFELPVLIAMLIQKVRIQAL